MKEEKYLKSVGTWIQPNREKDTIICYPPYLNIEWTFKEKKYLLWLHQLNVDTFETFEVILQKINYNGSEKANS